MTNKTRVLRCAACGTAIATVPSPHPGIIGSAACLLCSHPAFRVPAEA